MAGGRRSRGAGGSVLGTAAAWQAAQAAARLRGALGAAPAGGCLPAAAAHEVRRALALLQQGAADDAGDDPGGALAAAEAHLRACLARLRPAAAAAACVHAHLFAAWARGAAEQPQPQQQEMAPAGGGWGPISRRWRLGSRQYGRLVVALGLQAQLLDQLAWLQLAPGAAGGAARVREGAALESLQLALLARAARAVPQLAAGLLQRVLPADGAAGGGWRPGPVSAVLLLSLRRGAAAGEVAEGVSSAPDRAACVRALASAALLLAGAPGVAEQGEGGVALPVAVLQQLLCERDAPAAEAADGEPAHLPVSREQLLAAALGQLEALLLAWGHTWCDGDGATRHLLAQVHQRLQALLPAHLARQAAPSGAADGAPGGAALPGVTHQLLVHANSRLALTLMLLGGPGEQQQTDGPLADAPATSAGGGAADWAAVRGDPFGWSAQRLLRCSCRGGGKPEPEREAGGADGGGAGGGERALCWLCCLAAPQPCTPWSSGAPGGRLPCSLIPQAQVPPVPPPARPPVAYAAAEALAPPVAPCAADAASHLAGLAAAWLTPGFSLGPLLQPPTGAGEPALADDGGSGSGGGPDDLLEQLAGAAGADTFGALRLSGCLLEMLAHVALARQEQQHQERLWRPASALEELLLAMLAPATQALHEPALQQALLAALYSGPAWPRLRSELAARPGLAASAARGLVAASNTLVERDAAAGAGADGGGVARQAAVLPQRAAQAALLAELSRVLLLHVLLWPELTVRRLLLDGVQHRAQQPLVLQLFAGMAAACAVPAAAPLWPPAPGGPGAKQESAEVSVLLDQLLRLLLPPPGGASFAVGGVAAEQAAPLELTEGQRGAAVCLVQRLLEEGLLQQRPALQLLCARPLAALARRQAGAAAGGCSPCQLRLLLALAEGLLGLAAVGPLSSGSAGSAGSLLEQCMAAQPACRCPLVATHATCEALLAATDGAAGAEGPTLGELLLGLCAAEEQLQQAALLELRPDFEGAGQAVAVLEALCFGRPAAGRAEQSAAAPPALLTTEQLQRLPWPQRLLLAPAAAGSGASAELSALLQPRSLAPGEAGGVESVAGARQLLLDCCSFAAASDTHALLLAQALAAAAAGGSGGPDPVPPPLPPPPPPCPAAGGPASGEPGSQPLRDVARGLAAATLGLPWELTRQGATLALGQALPWAAEHQAARVLLRLLPALLAAALRPRPPQQQFAGAVWLAELQLVARGSLLFLMHGRWAQRARGAAPAALQAAGEQCFRRASHLAMHAAGQARGWCGDGAAGAAAGFDLLRACVRELCQLAAALSGAGLDCAALQVLLLQLLAALCEWGGDGARRNGAAAAADGAWRAAAVLGRALREEEVAELAAGLGAEP
ncbi:hypothetical protein HT031_002636 [Scenedesmus sp. PABB004]|nr:hypothetical protein HT031_002636 [Scenedesmus sp. PABB004]